jgi:uncharacterized membrane protein YgaE (UPF0421/DUF939 family)
LRSWPDTRQLIVHANERLRAGFLPVLLASVAAVAAWVLAHDVLGHAQPFFAPIAAAISLSTSPIQRSRRIVQLVAGVLLGIGIGELLVALLGSTTLALGLIVFFTLSAALLSGEGVFGEGMMFANQAAASAILVVTLHRAGTGSERVVDALVGGAVALVLGVVLFPAHPMRLLQNAERAVLRTVADLVAELSAFLQSGAVPPADWALQSSQHVHQLLSGLARARSTARANVRVAPRRFHLRATVDAEVERTARLDLLANAVLSLIRASVTAEEREGRVSDALAHDIGALSASLGRLAGSSRPWRAALLTEIRAQALRIGEDAANRANEDPVVATIVRAVATDLEAVLEAPAARPPSPRDVAPHAA